MVTAGGQLVVTTHAVERYRMRVDRSAGGDEVERLARKAGKLPWDLWQDIRNHPDRRVRCLAYNAATGWLQLGCDRRAVYVFRDNRAQRATILVTVLARRPIRLGKYQK